MMAFGAKPRVAPAMEGRHRAAEAALVHYPSLAVHRTVLNAGGSTWLTPWTQQLSRVELSCVHICLTRTCSSEVGLLALVTHVK